MSTCNSARPLYSQWSGMNNRCHNENDHAYAYYGGRGIQVCPGWRRGNDGAFLAFESWITDNLGPRPEGMTLDRIDNDGNYEPGNLRWADHATQMRNRRAGSQIASRPSRNQKHYPITWRPSETLATWIKKQATEHRLSPGEYLTYLVLKEQESDPER